MNLGTYLSYYAFALSCIALILSCISYWVSRRKATKRWIDFRLKSIEQDLKFNQIHHEVKPGLTKDELKSTEQAWVVSNEISLLRTLVETIRKDLQANAQTVASNTNSIFELQRVLDNLAPLGTKGGDISAADSNVFGKFDASNFRASSESNLFPSLDEVVDMRTQPKAEDLEKTVIEQRLAAPTVPYEIVCQQYQSAIDQGDRQALRQLQIKELNITSECEDLLVRGNTEQATRLEAVLGGGSYVVISGDQRYWLFPTSQTLDSFGMNQPQKGIFSYERELISRPMVKQPAEVREEGEYWVVVTKGVVAIPG